MLLNPYAIFSTLAGFARASKSGPRVFKLSDGRIVRRGRWSAMAQICGRWTRGKRPHSVLCDGSARTVSRGTGTRFGPYATGGRGYQFGTVIMSSAVVCLLAACGGGGGGSSPADAPKGASIVVPVTPVVVPKVSVTAIDYEGDSTAYGLQKQANGTFIQSPNNVPALIAKAFPAIKIENNGSPGSDVTQAVAGTAPYYAAPMATRLATDPAQIVIGNWAINDSYLETPEQYRQGLIDWINVVRATGKTPVLEEPNPVYPNSAAMDQMVVVMDDVAATMSVLIVRQYATLKALPNLQTLLSDGIHPTDALYAMKADNVATVIKGLL